jgi:hypothetical protein
MLPETGLEAPVSTSCQIISTQALASCLFTCNPGDTLSVSAQNIPDAPLPNNYRNVEAKCSGSHVTCIGIGGCTKFGTERISVAGTGVCTAPVPETFAQCGASGGVKPSVGPSPAPITPSANGAIQYANGQSSGASDIIASPAHIATYSGQLLHGSYLSGEFVTGINNVTIGSYYTLVGNNAGQIYGLETRRAVPDSTTGSNVSGYVVFDDRQYSPGVYEVVEGADGTGNPILAFTTLPVSVGAQPASEPTEPQDPQDCAAGAFYALSPSAIWADVPGPQSDSTTTLEDLQWLYSFEEGRRDSTCSVTIDHVWPQAVTIGASLNGTLLPSGGARFAPAIDLNSWQDPSPPQNTEESVVIGQPGIYLHDNVYTYSSSVSVPYRVVGPEGLPNSGTGANSADDEIDQGVADAALAEACVVRAEYIVWQLEAAGDPEDEAVAAAGDLLSPAGCHFGAYIGSHVIESPPIKETYNFLAYPFQNQGDPSPWAQWQDDPLDASQSSSQPDAPQPFQQGDDFGCRLACYSYGWTTRTGNEMMQFLFRSDNSLSSDYAQGYVHVNMEVPQGAQVDHEGSTCPGCWNVDEGSGHFALMPFTTYAGLNAFQIS